ncbi:DUF21-domain-containing protein [Lindgomyces ingoldianus]|uniref:DUF21-domain-containing protein n=1 Tax=Lindgomyces ingoldianus TaxID=673940 RepID=A0ACB6R225_9PLEO|nr:DUF21-domain-containing protein [Lindgomyces ingoldianus]KAF2472491.1 DUF21-domain-containing protein [Lindgomyces ingoldianus]
MADANCCVPFGVGNGLFSLNGARFALILSTLLTTFASLVKAIPVQHSETILVAAEPPKPAGDLGLWAYLGTAVALVLLGGAFAGLTIALMGQDEIYLQVIATSGEGPERKNAKKVLKLLKRGKHWVLVTLLLSNVITNETLPIVLDRSLGGGWPAVLSSTVLIVIFGEIVPQSICVRYGLPIGAWMSPLVLGLMWIMAPVAWPTAKLLDKLLGEDHGTTYKKAGLKTLVTLHKTLGTSPNDRLNQDEVTIITAVLDLKEKAVGSIMTPMKDVFTMSADTVLDEDMMDTILSAGYSRIPIHTPQNPKNFVGMLLVKMLITYDPEDALRVRDFALATLPETRPETSCLDIINFFQEGKSHMVLVSDYPGESYGAVGVVTLEDVIEELIGEEIIDESDVFIDVHKAIRRMAPAPRTRIPKGDIIADSSRPSELKLEAETTNLLQKISTAPEYRKLSVPENTSDGKIPTTFLMRRRSSGQGSIDRGTVVFRSDDPEVMQHLKHLGPSNAATRPKQTRINTVKIKPGLVNNIPNTIPENTQAQLEPVIVTPSHAPQGGAGEGLLDSAGRDASDGVHSLAVGYGTMSTASKGMSWGSPDSHSKTQNKEERTSPNSQSANQNNQNGKIVIDLRPQQDRPPSPSTVGSLHSIRSASAPAPMKRHTARSGSISENIVDLNGVKKIVLETTSSSESEDKTTGGEADVFQDRRTDEGFDGKSEDKKSGKKRRKKRGKKKPKNGAGESSESQPLLGGDNH